MLKINAKKINYAFKFKITTNRRCVECSKCVFYNILHKYFLKKLFMHSVSVTFNQSKHLKYM